MKVFSRISILIVSLGMGASALASSSLPGEQKAPIQYYQQSLDSQPKQQAAASSSANVPQAEQRILGARRITADNQMAYPQQARTGLVQAQNQAHVSASKQAVKPQSSKPQASSASLGANNSVRQQILDDAKQQQALEAQLDTLNQNGLLYQQRTNTQIEQLTHSLKGMQDQIKQLNQALYLLNQEVVGLNKQPVIHTAALSTNTASSTTANPIVNYWRQHRSWSFYGAAIALLLVLTMLVWMVWPKRKKASAAYHHQPAPMPTQTADIESTDDTQAEYDYMGSTESIPAKLNLARAYIAMEDYQAAKKVIAEVLNEGDSQQIQQAEGLAKTLEQADT